MRSILSFIILFASLSLAQAYEPIHVKDIRQYSLHNGVRLIVETTGVVEFTQGQLKNPERLFFDLRNALLSKDIKREIQIGKEPVLRIRLGQFSSNVVRVVFDMAGSDYQFRVILLEDPPRVVIDVYSERAANTRKDQPLRSESRLSKKRKVVLDPGHGGKDPGAVGPSGLMEKDVVLDVALKVKEILEREPGFDVILTRDRDVYLSLNERTDIANRVNADVFISIHTNASTNPLAKGVETYILNWTDDEEAMKVAARENALPLARMKQLKGELGSLLASLEREAKRDDSVKLAGYLHSSISESLRRSFARNDNGLKQALFYVLVGAQMPSCLLEISYISNAEEERLLATEQYRLKIANSIAEGIKDYFNKVEKEYRVKYTNNFIQREDSRKKRTKDSEKRENNKTGRPKRL